MSTQRAAQLRENRHSQGRHAPAVCAHVALRTRTAPTSHALPMKRSAGMPLPRPLEINSAKIGPEIIFQYKLGPKYWKTFEFFLVYWIVLERRRSAVLAVSAPTAPAGTRPCRPLLPKTPPKHPAQLPAAGAPRQRPQRTRGGCQIAAPLQGDARRAADRRGMVPTGRATAGGWCAGLHPGTLRTHWPRAWPVSDAQRRGVLERSMA